MECRPAFSSQTHSSTWAPTFKRNIWLNCCSDLMKSRPLSDDVDHVSAVFNSDHWGIHLYLWSVFVCLYGINSVTEWWFVSSRFYELHKAAHLFFWFKGLFENSLTVSCTVSMDGMHFFYFYFYFLSHNQKNFMWLNLFSNPSALSYSLVLTLQLKWWLCTNPAERRK